MKRHTYQAFFTPSAMLAVLAVLAAAWVVLPRIDSIGSVSSDRVDDMLYARLDTYERRVASDPELSRIFTTAMTSTDSLTAEELARFLDQERLFVGGWEVAWLYRKGGQLDRDRFEVWDEWYVSELSRRPDIAWTGNRRHFSEAFARHVDRHLAIDDSP